MPPSKSVAFLRKFFLRSGDIPVAGWKMGVAGMLPPPNLAGLASAKASGKSGLIATIPFQHADLHAKDTLGHVYEYHFLSQSGIARRAA